MMQNVVNSGTGRAAQIGRPVAGKTGTSEEARDLWFIGFVPQMATGVWLGNDDNSPTWSYSSTAAEVWHNFMTTVVKGMPPEKFPELPKLDNRKGSLKAKPVRPASMYDGEAPQPEDRSSDSYREEPRWSEPAAESSGGYADSAPAPEAAPAPAPQAAPEPAPPQEAAPELPPAEPAPPATTSGPSQAEPSN
jgi:penicillin-binding protein 1A